MKHFPIFIALEGRRVVLSSGDATLDKLSCAVDRDARTLALTGIVDSLNDGQFTTPANVLEPTRREAAFGALPATSRSLINAATHCDHVSCLTLAAPDSWQVAACLLAVLPPQIISGIAPVSNLYPLEETA